MQQVQLRAPAGRYSPANRRVPRILAGLPHLLLAVSAALSTGASYRTQNFVVTASDTELAHRVALAAENHRRALSERWLGAELPPWRDACPIVVRESPDLPANGNTSFVFVQGRPTGWRMSIQGRSQSIFESVLPHEVAHTVFATYFGRPLPRWLEEGVCVAVENESSQSTLQRTAVDSLRGGSAFTLERLFAMTEYPRDVLPFYSQGYSLTRFLIEHGGEKKLVQFISDGLNSNDWGGAARKHYGYESLSHLQGAWISWVMPLDLGRRTE